MTRAIPLTTHERNRFDDSVEQAGLGSLEGLSIDTVQVNIGLRCNLACHHCHVSSSPKRREEMTWETMQLVLDATRRAGAQALDITGGAPEMHPQFRKLVDTAVVEGLHVMVRTNLTIMLQPGHEDLPEYFSDRRVHLIASLPCYLEVNVDKQRGRHVYRDSIEVVHRLNGVGYGIREELPLDLVYNPGGPSLPPPQERLQAAYKTELLERFGIRFSRLLMITNMPIGRFLHDLSRDGKDQAYTALLRNAFNPATVDGLMCRHQLHVGWDGTLYDCDFNYALSLPVNGPQTHVRDFNPAEFLRRRIATGEHCFGCTAGCGSSCKGSLA